MCYSSTYQSYRAMLTRCYNPRQQSYLRYGARGICVCDRWREGFENFLSDMGLRPAGMTLDRIDPFGNYESGNCRWSTRADQSRNQRRAIALRVLNELDPQWFERYQSFSPAKAFEDGYTRVE